MGREVKPHGVGRWKRSFIRSRREREGRRIRISDLRFGLGKSLMR